MSHHHFHPIFGHTIANEDMKHHSHPLSLNAPVVHVKAIIKKVEKDVQVQGVSHQHFLINQIVVIGIQGGDKSIVTDEVFVAVLHFTHHPVGFVIYKGMRYE